MLYNARKELRKQGVCYPDITPANHSITFWPIFTQGGQKLRRSGKNTTKKEYIANCKQRWLREFDKNNCDNFIISGERMSILPLKRIETVKQSLSEHFDEVRVIVYLRHYDTYLSSILQQRIKNCKAPTTIQQQMDNLFKDDWRFLSYSHIEQWIKVVGEDNVIIRPFDSTQFKNGDLLDDFFDAADININTRHIKREFKNSSIGGNATRLLAELSLKYPYFKGKKLNDTRGMARGSLPTSVFMVDGDDKFNLTGIDISNANVDKLNKEIAWANKHFKDDYIFKPYTYKKETIPANSLKDIPSDFYVELVNNFLLELERRVDTIADLREEIKTLSRKKK